MVSGPEGLSEWRDEHSTDSSALRLQPNTQDKGSVSDLRVARDAHHLEALIGKVTLQRLCVTGVQF